ncbi:hypothetical protein CUJ88_18990 [Paraburkholderia hospita]|uniref:Uncharacterized protein n=1 Tax=Paraburkholderia hospita TaxID=169430 RepID=A0AAN1JFA5_9BURK|nr:hypothetical protein C2L64_28845 [Paraburkholderia hospita]AXF00635.1 hypothetical protein CUJ88_18990 [Paraburkholderia hospita]
MIEVNASLPHILAGIFQIARKIIPSYTGLLTQRNKHRITQRACPMFAFINASHFCHFYR